MRKHEEHKFDGFGSTVFSLAPFIFGGAIAMGCGPGGVPETHGGPSLAREVAAVIYEEAFSETGRIQVYRDSHGRLSTGVIGGIGKDDATMISRSLDHSLIKMHQNLRPGVPVPAELAAFDAQLSARTFTTRSDATAAPAEDFNDFLDTVCRPFAVSGGTMQAQACNYSYWANVKVASRLLCGNCGDWSFFWNTESNQNALHGEVQSAFTEGDPTSAKSDERSDSSRQAHTPLTNPPLYGAPAGTWGYHNWWGYYDFYPGVAFTSPYAFAPLGVTVHRFVADPPGAQ